MTTQWFCGWPDPADPYRTCGRRAVALGRNDDGVDGTFICARHVMAYARFNAYRGAKLTRIAR